MPRLNYIQVRPLGEVSDSNFVRLKSQSIATRHNMPPAHSFEATIERILNDPLIRPTRTPKSSLFFANITALMWLYYCIGSWYGSRFIPEESFISSEPALLFGGTFAIWFSALFSHIAVTLIKLHTRKG